MRTASLARRSLLGSAMGLPLLARPGLAQPATEAAGTGLLIADEATSRLDPLTQQEVMALLGECVQERNMALLVVTHEAALAAKVAGRVISLG
jgi:ABC-type glutathione transport system ATPase component